MELFDRSIEHGKISCESRRGSVGVVRRASGDELRNRTQGRNHAYTSVNGNMFSFLTADGTLALRLSTSDRKAFLKKYETTLCEQYGAVMKEYVRVPTTLLPNTRQLAKYIALSYLYARSLKPKPTTKRKPAKQSTTAGRVRRTRERKGSE
jgi:TfoX/Sxy family transcriptional regulator of competence genes